MKYTFLGQTGVTVSRICLGCMSYGSSKWLPWVLDEEQAMPLFREAVEQGINFFDTADLYSLGASEVVTGKAVREYARLEECVIASKIYFPMGEGPNRGGLSRKHIQQGCEASLKRLGVDTIDLYYTHRFDPHTPIEEMLSALDLLVRHGKVRYLGACTAAAWKFAHCLSLSEQKGWARFVAMQNHYNLIYREEEREMLPLCKAEGVGVLPYSPLARGVLAGKRKSATDTSGSVRAETDKTTQQMYDSSDDAAVVEAVKRVAAQREAEPAQVALAWLLSRPGVVSPIVGATKPEHLRSAASAVELQLHEEEIRQLETPYRPHPVRDL
jgi:aryl-alcohol dehydrogenase-like predicted oxidoreductase